MERDMFDTFLSQADVAKLSKFLGKTLKQGVLMSRQYTKAPWPGCACSCWMVAQVENLQNCVKIAWDIMIPERIWELTWPHGSMCLQMGPKHNGDQYGELQEAAVCSQTSSMHAYASASE